MSHWLGILILIAGLSPKGFAQDNAKSILEGVYEKFQKVDDYRVDVKIKTEIFFINILPINAIIYFKQPDKMRIKATGIALLPRQGFDQIFKMLGDHDNFSYLMQGTETIRNVQTTVISVLPNTDTSDIVLTRFWIETSKSLIRRAQMTSKTNGTVTMDYSYGRYEEYGLSDSIQFSIDVKKFKIPKALAADLNKPAESEVTKKDNKKGKIILLFNNYRINQGIEDRIFTEKE